MIQFKIKGYIAIEIKEKQTKGGKVRQIVNALSPEIFDSREDAIELQKKIESEKGTNVVKQHLEIIAHAANIQQLRKDVIIAKNNIKKAKAFKWIKGLWSNSINYFRMQCAKIKLFRYINSLNKATKTFLNDFLEYSQSVGSYFIHFNLNNLNIA